MGTQQLNQISNYPSESFFDGIKIKNGDTEPSQNFMLSTAKQNSRLSNQVRGETASSQLNLSIDDITVLKNKMRKLARDMARNGEV